MLIQSQAQAEALDKLLKLTWGAFFTSVRRLYTVIIQSLITYCVSAWVSALSIIQRLDSTQNKCLWVIAGAYKATPTCELEIKTFISPINLYLQECTRAFYQRVSDSLYKQTREKFCSWIHQKIKHCHCWLVLRASLLVSAPALSIINIWTIY